MMSMSQIIACTALLFGTCSGNHLREHPQQKERILRTGLPTIDTIIINDPNLTTLASAFIAADLNGTLCTDCNFTIFAPTDAAFGAINETVLESLLKPERIMHLSNLLSFHITNPTSNGMRVLTSDYVDGQVITMRNDENVTVNVLNQTINLINNSGNRSRIVENDILASNGVLNKVNTVFLPQFLETNVFELGDMYVDFTILDELFQMAGLTDLQGDYTVLAPDNDAWMALGEDRLAELRNNTVALGETLRNHIVPGLIPPNMLTDEQVLTPLGGSNVTVSRTLQTSPFFLAAQESPMLMFNNVTVSQIILAANGIVYRIGSVLTLSSVPITPSAAPIVQPVQPITPATTPNSIDLPAAVPATLPTSVPVPIVVPIPIPVVNPTSTPVATPVPIVTQTTAPASMTTGTPMLVPVIPPTISPIKNSTLSPVVESMLCIDFDCGVGYVLRENPENRTGSDRETCCIQDGTCNGVPSGSVCFIGGVESSIIPNPSFEMRAFCPTTVSQLDLADSWMQATAATTDYFVGAPSCDETWWRNGPFEIGPLPRNASDGDAFVGAIHSRALNYYEYLGTCLNSPLKAGVEYTLNLDVAAAAFSMDIGFRFGGDTNGVTEILCIPSCDTFESLQFGVTNYQGDSFEIVASAAPGGGLIGGGDWKTISFNFIPSIDCPAIMIGAGASHSVQEGQNASYVLYDSLNLQERIAGVCNNMSECVQPSRPTISPSSVPSLQPSTPRPIMNADGTCDGVPSGSVCFIGDLEFSIISNPSFENYEDCYEAESWAIFYNEYDYYVRSPSCAGSSVGYSYNVTQNATNGVAFAGATHNPTKNEYQYLGTCLNTSLMAGKEYTLTMDVAAVAVGPVSDGTAGGDTDGATDILCITDCSTFESLYDENDRGYQGDSFEILVSSAPNGGLIGGGDWKTVSFNFIPSSDCPAIMISASASRTIQDGSNESNVLYDSINLQERVAGVCSEMGKCIQPPRPTASPILPSDEPSSSPSSPIP